MPKVIELLLTRRMLISIKRISVNLSKTAIVKCRCFLPIGLDHTVPLPGKAFPTMDWVISTYSFDLAQASPIVEASVGNKRL